MSMLRTLMCLVTAAMIINSAIATTTFTVGGPTGGWDIGTNLQTWSSSQPFSVGDGLIFQYTPNHNLLEVSKEDYDACQSSNPIQVYPSGATPITLTAPGSRYFICGVGGHCSLGMKVEILTLGAPALSPAQSPETTTLPSDPPISPSAYPSPTETPSSQPPASAGPMTVPSFPLTGSPQSFNPANALSTLPPPIAAAKARATSSILFVILMLVALFL
ncbi:Phytocyanin domain-containing protein [Heracleum sosnowskyi]|uniref:Phytocyanin domain-containing protein n=1 Tax=Heracleum sosnowskyi TaxID=360622 RepID=A0AAD8IYN8_9APIA|nr:Phytocyanin domain-containing protein [Heracleum sosnowskyi]